MKHMILSFKMKGDVRSDHFLMLWFQKKSLDTVGFRTLMMMMMMVTMVMTTRAPWKKEEEKRKEKTLTGLRGGWECPDRGSPPPPPRLSCNIATLENIFFSKLFLWEGIKIQYTLQAHYWWKALSALFVFQVLLHLPFIPQQSTALT